MGGFGSEHSSAASRAGRRWSHPNPPGQPAARDQPTGSNCELGIMGRGPGRVNHDRSTIPRSIVRAHEVPEPTHAPHRLRHGPARRSSTRPRHHLRDDGGGRSSRPCRLPCGPVRGPIPPGRHRVAGASISSERGGRSGRSVRGRPVRASLGRNPRRGADPHRSPLRSRLPEGHAVARPVAAPAVPDEPALRPARRQREARRAGVPRPLAADARLVRPGRDRVVPARGGRGDRAEAARRVRRARDRAGPRRDPQARRPASGRRPPAAPDRSSRSRSCRGPRPATVGC